MCVLVVPADLRLGSTKGVGLRVLGLGRPKHESNA